MSSKTIGCKSYIVLLVLLFISGCASVPPAVIPLTQDLKPSDLPDGKSRPVYLSIIENDLNDKIIGRITFGAPCYLSGDLKWKNSHDLDREIIYSIKNQFKSYNFQIDSSKPEKESDLRLTVQIDDVKANLCEMTPGAKGKAAVALLWKISGNKKEAIEFTTMGSAIIENFTLNGSPDIYLYAIENATRNLLASDGFVKLVKK